MAKVKVIQCWDDAPYTDLRLLEILRKYNAKATFNLNPGMMSDKRENPYWLEYKNTASKHCGFSGGRLSLNDIKEVYDGFELASHCFNHENAAATPVDEWIKSAVQAREFLENIVQKPCRGFAWPYGTHTPETCAALRKAGFAYGRTVEYTDNIAECQDVMALPINSHFMSPTFYQRYERAKKSGIFYFWGHSYEMIDYDKLYEQFEMKIRYLTEDPDAEWCNVVDVAEMIDKKS